VRSAAALAVLLLLLWLAASGHYTMMITSFGVASSIGVAFLAWRMRIADKEGVPVHLLPRSLWYIPWIVFEVFKANVDVARRILGPRSAVNPKIIEAPTSQHSDLGRVLYANSITLTPGTVSIQVHGDRITVHAIAAEVADGLLEGTMDQQVSRFEGPT
jgi:multicomponent Na+:H+ antiporter subunit E